MSKSKSQNSIIALATLGVYLGLLLAGATPGVLAQQAALTKQFNLNDEIERKDDLDKKPDDECEARDALFEQANKLRAEIGKSGPFKGIFTDEIAEFVDDLLDDLRYDRHNLKNKFQADFFVKHLGTLDLQISSKIRNNFRYFGADKNKAGFFAEKLFSIVEEISRISCEGNTSNCSDVYIIFRFDETGFYTETNFSFPHKSASRAALFAQVYNLENQYEGCSNPDNDELVYDNTRAYSENDQVFIVTRLPRGSLDTLLATNAK